MKNSTEIMGNGGAYASRPKRLYVNEKELPQDNGTALVFRSRKGTLHEIFGAYGDRILVPPGFKEILAIKVKIAERACPLYEEANDKGPEKTDK